MDMGTTRYLPIKEMHVLTLKAQVTKTGLDVRTPTVTAIQMKVTFFLMTPHSGPIQIMTDMGTTITTM